MDIIYRYHPKNVILSLKKRLLKIQGYKKVKSCEEIWSLYMIMPWDLWISLTDIIQKM